MTTTTKDTNDTTSAGCGSLLDKVRERISQTISENESKYSIQDILRTISDESLLQYETQLVRDTILSDPFEQCGQHTENSDDEGDDSEILRNEFSKFAQMINVVECHRVTTNDGYCKINASCEINPRTAAVGKTKSEKRSKHPIIHLSFRYERNVKNDNTNPRKTTTFDAVDSTNLSNEATTEKLANKLDESVAKRNCSSLLPPYTVQYTIELSIDHGPKERMLFVQVFTENNVPSKNPAKNLVLDEDSIEDDINEVDDKKNTDDEEEYDIVPSKKSAKKKNFSDDKDQETPSKRLKREIVQVATGAVVAIFKTDSNDSEEVQGESIGDNEKKPDDNDDCDGYFAGIDPDVLDKFRTVCNLASHEIDDNNIIFLLLSIPFYEQEWDLVGYILESVFDENDASEASDEET